MVQMYPKQEGTNLSKKGGNLSFRADFYYDRFVLGEKSPKNTKIFIKNYEY